MSHSTTEPRWRRLPEERPKQILDAALAVFAERGLAAARLEDIAKRAGVSKGTIYLYFSNKEELFREVIRTTVIANIEQAETRVAAVDDPRQALLVWMEGYWAWLRSPAFPTIHRLVSSELHSFPDVAAFFAKEVIERHHRLICEMLERGMKRNAFRQMDPLVAARMLSAIFVMHALWYHRPNSVKSISSIPDDVILGQIREFFLHAMRPDVAGAPSHAR